MSQHLPFREIARTAAAPDRGQATLPTGAQTGQLCAQDGPCRYTPAGAHNGGYLKSILYKPWS